MNPRPATPLPEDGIEITGVYHDSRKIAPGGLFVCLPGLRRDGHEFAGHAMKAGAALLIGERVELPGISPYLRVGDSRRALALLSAAWYRHPSRSLELIGVTGTNGKSSVAWMLRSMLVGAGRRAAMMGTLGVGEPGRERPQPFTTPEAPEFQAELAQLCAAGVESAAVEVSSHGLEQRRTYGTRFAAVVFTNLTQDHLDFHQSMELYAAAKNLLFRAEERGPEEGPTRAVVNADDPHLAAILKQSRDRVTRYGSDPGAEVRIEERTVCRDGIRLVVAHPGGRLEIDSPLVGDFQVENLLAASATGLAIGIAPEQIAEGLSAVRAIPGRMERVDRGQPYLVLVDYAHTPDALRRALASLRPSTPGKLRLVFGCGGDRDRSKRFRMGQLAAQGADRVYLTDDNPRSEAPGEIRSEVAAGLAEGGGDWIEIGDRADAIAGAVADAGDGDTLLIAGKGHETVQIRGETVLPFDDRAIAAQSIEEREGAR